jgi:methyl-accepting chemotaxis protein
MDSHDIFSAIVPDFIRKSTALKFGIAITIVALLVGVTGLVATSQIATATQENIGENYASAAQTESENIADWHEQREALVEIAAGIIAGAEGARVDLGAQAESFQSEDGMLAEMHVITRNGRILESTDSELIGQQVSNSRGPWVEQVTTGEPTLSAERTDVYGQGDNTLVAFTHPVSEELNAYVVLVYDMEVVSGMLTGRFMDGDSFSVLVDNEQQIVAHDRDTSTLLGQYNDNELFNSATGLENGEFDFSSGAPPIDGLTDEETVVGYAPVEGTDWVVFVHSSTDDAYGFVGTIQRGGTIATLIGVFLIGAVGLGLGRNTASAVNSLSQKAKDLEEGDLDRDLSTRRIDEIGQLHNQFASMRDSLKNRITEAETAREEARLAQTEAEERATQLQEQAEAYSSVMQAVGGGDLTQRMSTDTTEESMEQIAVEFNEMIEEIEMTVGQLQRYVDEVERAGSEVETSAEAVRTASEQVADAIQEISNDAHTQTEQIDDIKAVLEEAIEALDAADSSAPGIEDTRTSLEDLTTKIDDLGDRTEEMLGETDTVSAAAQEQAAELNEVSETATDLQRYAEPLRGILEGFQAEQQHEFVFSVGPSGGQRSPGREEE